jgi:hypothetical protein
MTKSPRPPKPIESFGPEIFQALIEGAKRKVEFDLPYRKAVHFRQRVNQLRNQMRLQKHEHYAMASQARITITWPDDTPCNKSANGIRSPKDINTPVHVTIAPADAEFAGILEKAGVKVPELNTPLSPTKVEDDILAAYVKDNPS